MRGDSTTEFGLRYSALCSSNSLPIALLRQSLGSLYWRPSVHGVDFVSSTDGRHPTSAPPHVGSRGVLRSGEGEPWRGGQAEQGLRPGNGDPVPCETVVGCRRVHVAPEALEIGAVEQPATAALLVEGVDRLARRLRGERLVAPALRAILRTHVRGGYKREAMGILQGHRLDGIPLGHGIRVAGHVDCQAILDRPGLRAQRLVVGTDGPPRAAARG